MMNKRSLNLLPCVAVLCSCSLPAYAGQSSKKEKKTKPNVIIILADDLGYGDLECYGTTRVHTPNVNRLASEGIRFTNVHATASTSTPSRYALLTGEYAWRKKGTGVAAGNAGMIIRPEQYTIADMFKSADYTTGAIGKWHLGLGDKTGTQDWNGTISPALKDIGFDYSYIMAATADRVPCIYIENGKVADYDSTAPIEVSYQKPFEGEPTGRKNPELLYNLKPSHGHDMAIVNGISRIGYMKGGGKALWKDENIADTITSHAIRFIEENKERPFFLYFATNDVHVPRFPHERFRGKNPMGLRGDAIVQFDWSVGEIMKTLDRLGLTENTLIILSSDNGPVLDDGYLDRAYELNGTHRAAGPLRGGKYSKFDGGTRIPFIVYSSALKHRGVSEALISQVDLYASFAHMLGIETREDSAVDSQDRYAALIGEDPAGRSELMTEDLSCGKMLRCGSWVYLSPSEGAPYMPFTRIETGLSKDPQLYNMDYDIGQQNIAWNYADQVEKMEKRLQEILTSESTR